MLSKSQARLFFLSMTAGFSSVFLWLTADSLSRVPQRSNADQLSAEVTRGKEIWESNIGTGHHYYWTGSPEYWLAVGGFFSALEPLAFLGMALYGITMARRGGRKHSNRVALLWTVGTGIMSFVGVGFLGFAHTLPQVNTWTHGTLVTAMHGHMAFWGAYAMMVLAVISDALPQMTGRKLYAGPVAEWAFWIANIGMVAMTGAFAVAGITQVYLERRVGMDFLAVQDAVQIHFWGLILAACLFSIGIGLYIWDFVRYGTPSLEMVGRPDDAALPTPAK